MALSKHDDRERAGEPLSWRLDDPRDDAGTAWEGVYGLMERADAYLAARGKGSWGSVGLDALGLATGGLGRWGKGLEGLAGAEYGGSMGLGGWASAFSFGFSGFAYILGLADDAEAAGLAGCAP